MQTFTIIVCLDFIPLTSDLLKKNKKINVRHITNMIFLFMVNIKYFITDSLKRLYYDIKITEYRKCNPYTTLLVF